MEKLKLYQYHKNFPKKFDQEKKKISKAIGNYGIYHIGSTAVEGLGGKGIIDIMIGVNNWEEAKDIAKKLKKIGFKHVHRKIEKGELFLSKHQKATLDNVHIHIAKKESKVYQDLFSFRDYLRKNKKEAQEYFRLKTEALAKAKGSRVRYNKLKARYIETVLKKIKN
ncbi:MAG: hypothetical protein QG648_440 [Patescibacteria group bacterium]|nr:hypothetical protein [Patescibacteria group bacterium]